jgi:tetratricopeptide (TPR) repeat protein
MNKIDLEKEFISLIQQNKTEHFLKLINHHLCTDVRSNNLSLLCIKSSILMRLGKYTEAKICLDHAYKIDNSNADVNSGLAAYYSIKNDFDSAIECYDRILKNDPKSFTYIFEKFKLFLRQQKWIEADDCVLKLLKYHWHNPLTYEVAACYYIARKEYDHAAFYYKLVLSVNPTSSAALEFMVQFWYRKKQYEKAYDILKLYSPKTSFEKDFINKWRKKIELQLDLLKRQKLSL